MKKIIFALSLALASFAASAQSVADQFTTTDGSISFSLVHAREIKFLAGEVYVVYDDGNTAYLTLTDQNGVLSTRIKNSNIFNRLFILSTSNNTYYAPAYSKSIQCISGQTVIRWNFGGSTNIGDNCAFWTKVKAASYS